MKEILIEKQKELNLYRVLTVIASTLYPLLGYFNTFVLVPQFESIEFFYQRLLWAFLSILMLVTSYFFKVVRNYYYLPFIFLIFVLTLHLFYSGKTNGFNFHFAIGIMVVMMGSAFVMRNLKLLSLYLTFTIITAIISILYARTGEIPAIKLIPIYFILCAYLYFVLSTKLKLEVILKRSLANAGALINNTNDIIWSIDTDFKYIAFNKAFEQTTFLLTGKSPVVGELTLVESTNEEIGQKLKSIYMAGLFGNSMSVEQAINLNGKINYMSVSSKPIRLPNGKIIGVTIFGHNVTEAKLAEQKINHQRQLIVEKHKEITDSITYAERIQRSFLATNELLNENLKEYFVFFQPRDVVSGDFYWAAKLSNGNFALMTADSTGHGVPGAIMSILNITCVEKAVEEEELLQPSKILNHTRDNIIKRLQRDGSEHGGKDGMDAILICFDFKKSQLTYAAAHNSIWIVRNGQLHEYEADKMPVGKHDKDSVSFTQHVVTLHKGDVVYSLTDGMADQFGGPNGKKFMYKRLKELLISIADKPMTEQKESLMNALNDWKGDLEQVDDICVIGVRV